MRYILIFWAVPMSFFWGWYYLSFYDINFGLLFFSRVLHDFVFEVYAHYLGLEASAIPGMIAKACVVDTLLIMAILAFRRRKRIAAWWASRKEANSAGFSNQVLEAGQEPLEG